MTWALTPGAYLKRRRQAQRLSLEEVAAALPTEPHLPAHDRVAWLERIEADVMPATAHTIAALRTVYRFDVSVLVTLAAIARGEWSPDRAPQLCRICACSWSDPCTHAGEACGWSTRDLCTACTCAPRSPAQPTTAPTAIAARAIVAGLVASQSLFLAVDWVVGTRGVLDFWGL